MKEVKTPECDRLAAVKDQSQAIGEFLEWLGSEKNFSIAETHTHGPKCEGWDHGRNKFNPDIGEEYCRLGPDGRLWAVRKSIGDLLAEYFEIDMSKVEKERRAILDALRKASK